MAYRTNISAFLSISSENSLASSYAKLIACELALKDANCHAPGNGHDVPAMLTIAAALPGAQVFLSAQLIGLITQLNADLAALQCLNKAGVAVAVRSTQYPDMRYTRHSGDWGGVSETPDSAIDQLETTCSKLCELLAAHGSVIGVFL
jgi:hypothetical protein